MSFDKFESYDHTSVNATLLLCGLLHNRDTIVAYVCILESNTSFKTEKYLTVIFQIIIKQDTHP